MPGPPISCSWGGWVESRELVHSVSPRSRALGEAPGPGTVTRSGDSTGCISDLCYSPMQCLIQTSGDSRKPLCFQWQSVGKKGKQISGFSADLVTRGDLKTTDPNLDYTIFTVLRWELFFFLTFSYKIRMFVFNLYSLSLVELARKKKKRYLVQGYFYTRDVCQ